MYDIPANLVPLRVEVSESASAKNKYSVQLESTYCFICNYLIVTMNHTHILYPIFPWLSRITAAGY